MRGPSATSHSRPSRRILPETLLASVLVPAAVLMAAGYLVDLLRGPIAPGPMAVIALASFIVTAWTTRGLPAVDADEGERLATALTATVVIGSLAYFLWLASPSELPVTNGPDVVHHLVLIHLIQRTEHLVHGSALNVYLLEMAGYTPGSHILAALIAAWSRIDAVRVVQPIAAAFTALALGAVYVIAFRSLAGHRRAAWQSCAAPLLALVPAVYTLGAFMHFFYFAQVVAGTFSLTMLLSVIAAYRLGSAAALTWCGLSAVGIVLAWPVWIVPPVLAGLGITAFHKEARFTVFSIVVALVPAAVLFALHALQHRGAVGTVTTSGAVVAPSLAAFGRGFIVCAAAGVAVAAVTRRSIAILAFAGAVVLEAAALLALNRAAGSDSDYLPFKMMFLLVPAAAVV